MKELNNIFYELKHEINDNKNKLNQKTFREGVVIRSLTHDPATHEMFSTNIKHYI